MTLTDRIRQALKRHLFVQPFKVVARVGSTGSDETVLEPDDNIKSNNLDVVITPRRDGELFLYVNDSICRSTECVAQASTIATTEKPRLRFVRSISAGVPMRLIILLGTLAIALPFVNCPGGHAIRKRRLLASSGATDGAR
ncbi:hypothetical protein HAP48_0023400 [Bradyrhizobium septentrionale]|uniref:Uncharacterized protein n=1 Tax=Bradyrhizobium septentrionale TaxID=1404411 RepID=A0A973ZZK5_9BRAD|nr:hypothetical protein [Bradyrhizobium septentrionale]UGY20143.1 hypothetical protein HAP48_0023400 [Bradyrhizobium septentrionale]